jgi:hypothetical protein
MNMEARKCCFGNSRVPRSAVDRYGRVSFRSMDAKLSAALRLHQDAAAYEFSALSRGQDDCGV